MTLLLVSQEEKSVRVPRSVTAIQCGRIYPVSGPRIERGVILVENGIIVDVVPGDRIPEGATVVDASGQVVVPGLVDASTWLAGAGAAEETIAPEVKAVDGLNLFESNRAALSGGVTAAYVAPGARRLISGQGAVVKTAGQSRILDDSFGLHVALGNAVKHPPLIYRPPVLPSAEDPILPAKRQYPWTRMGEFAELRKVFQKAREERWVTFADVLAGREPVVVSASTSDDIVRAVLLAEEAGVKLILLDAVEAYKVADFLAERKVPVLLQASFGPRRGYGIDDHRAALESKPDVRAAAMLAKAGVPLALHAATDGEMSDLLFLAGAMVRWGLSEEEALRSVTLAPAEFLGVSDRIGSLSKGKHADLVFLSADPFQAASLPERVMIDGEVVYQRKASDVMTYDVAKADASRSKKREVLAIRAGKILSVTQGVIQDGLILIENGKITYVGRGRSVPTGAKVIDASRDVVVPGMIDLNSHLGFHLDQSENWLRRTGGFGDATPPQSLFPPSRFVRLDDPAFRDAAVGGVTSIVLTPRSAGPCSVIKLSGEVLREVGAYKFSVAGGTAAQDQLRQQLQRAKKYHEEWEAYEKAQKEGKEAPPPKEGGEAPKADPITGTWKGTMEIPQYNMKGEFTAELKLAGTRVTGTITTQMGGESDSDSIEGTFVNDELKVEGEQQGAKYQISMKVAAPNHLRGTWSFSSQGMQMSGPIECTRIAGGEGLSTSAPKSGDKKEPKRDETLDPYRPLFRREVPALLEIRDYPGVENAVKIFRDEFNLDYIVAGAGESIHLAELLFAKTGSVALHHGFLSEKRGAFVNVAEALASGGVPVAFYSDESSGTKLLPVTVSYAVRYGMDPFDALKAVTLNPARMLGLDARIGSIERGRDADLLVLTGEPFHLSTRVKSVWINGKIVVEP